MLFIGVIIGPIIETAINQAGIIMLIKETTDKMSYLLGIPTFIFALMHIFGGIPLFLATIPIGFLLDVAFNNYYDESLPKAFLLTFSIHALHNLISMTGYIISKNI